MNNMKRIMTIVLAAVMIFTFIPFFGGSMETYAAGGETRNCEWINSAVWGTPNGYAVAGSTITVDMNNLDYMADEDGYNVSSPIAGSDPSEVHIEVQYKADSASETVIISRCDKADGDLKVDVPESAADSGTICIMVNDYFNDNWYYYSKPIHTRAAKVSDDFAEDLGTLTITLPDAGCDKTLTSADRKAIRNTLLFAAESGNIQIKLQNEEDVEIDINNDYIPDMTFGKEKVNGKVRNYVLNYTDQVSQNSASKNVTVKSGAEFDPQNVFTDPYIYYLDKIPYYSKLVLKIPKRTIDAGKVTVDKTEFVYNGKSHAPVVKSLVVNSTKLVKGTDYKVSGSRTAIGEGKITITGIGKYKNTITRKFTIKPGKVSITSVAAGKKKFTVKWGKKSGDVNYQIKYRVKGASTWKTTTATANSKTIEKLKSGKTYQVKVRAYKKVSGKTYYGQFSDIKTVKVK